MEKMRLIVITDLPVGTRHERKLAREFRELLFEEGFSLLQEGVFTRLSDGRSSADMRRKRLCERCPETGTARLLMLTERQFQSSLLLAGHKGVQETEVDSQLDIFL